MWAKYMPKKKQINNQKNTKEKECPKTNTALKNGQSEPSYSIPRLSFVTTLFTKS